MKQYLKELGGNPTKENLDKVKFEIRRSEDIVNYHRQIIDLLENHFNDNNKKLLSKNLDAIEYELEFQDEANKIKVKIATILSNRNEVYY